tara:strand:- start:1015 stop:1590 length:576 start_codon:yes stop_codon:yes gene_type:complete
MPDKFISPMDTVSTPPEDNVELTDAEYEQIGLKLMELFREADQSTPPVNGPEGGLSPSSDGLRGLIPPKPLERKQYKSAVGAAKRRKELQGTIGNPKAPKGVKDKLDSYMKSRGQQGGVPQRTDMNYQHPPQQNHNMPMMSPPNRGNMPMQRPQNRGNMPMMRPPGLYNDLNQGQPQRQPLMAMNPNGGYA